MDADIAKCFDRINHKALLNKIDYKGKVRQQLKAWLKSGVVDRGTFTAVSEGTPQGGIVSPLLANIALHGIGKMLEDYAKSIPMREDNYPFRVLSKSRKVQTLAFIRYADDFVVIHKDLEVVQKCRDLISEWLKDMGLELKPSKTRIAHTLNPEKSENGKAGFDFLGYHIRQYPVSRHKSNKNGAGQILGFTTLISPSKQACKKHQEKIRSIFRKHKYSPQARLIQELNPVVRGWCNYYSFSDATTSGEFYRQDHLVFQKIRAWGKHRCRSKARAYREYFRRIGSRKWVFATKGADPYKLLSHGEFECSSTQYVKVRGDKSPYDGDLFYWSARMGRNPEMPSSKAIRLKKQKGKCKWCELHFREGDILEEDHIVPLALNGKNTIDNLQLLHRHCHDAKTALDLIDIRNNSLKVFFKKLTEEWSKVNFLWIYDMPVVFRS